MANNQNREFAPIRLELVIAIVNKAKASFYTDLLQSMGSTLQLSAAAKGTAELRVLEMFGLGEQEKTAIFSVVRADRLEETLEALEKRFETIKNGEGIALAIPFSSMIGTTLYGFLTGDERMVKNG